VGGKLFNTESGVGTSVSISISCPRKEMDVRLLEQLRRLTCAHHCVSKVSSVPCHLINSTFITAIPCLFH
jgi:hypothetical protein